jgi:hypothetical protein
MNPMGHSSEDIRYRFQWTFPIMFSPHNPRKLYAAGSQLFVTTDEGQSWTIISPPLVRADPKTMGPSGGPITRDQTGVETYATIFALAESPVTAGVLWTGSDDGIVSVSRDAGKTWKNVTPKDLPEFARISQVDASRFGAGTAYVAANRYALADKQPYLYKTTDYGATWRRIDNGIDREEFTRVVREDPEKRGLLYAGTERGVWMSFDDGANWQRLQLNLPKVPIHDLVVREGDIVLATHGRSFYILDDLSALRQMTPQAVAAKQHLFKPRDAYRIQWGGGFFGGDVSGHPSGKNPPDGAIVYYHLKDANREVVLDFLDAKGKVIRSFTSKQDSAAAADSVRKMQQAKTREDSLLAAGLPKDSVTKLLAPKPDEEDEPDFEQIFLRGPKQPRVPNKAGLNQFAWNLRYPDASRFEGMVMWAAGVQGPVAPPGTYAVRLNVNGEAAGTQTFKVLKDPRTKATPADLAEQFRFLIAVRDRVTDANDAVKTIRNVKSQIDDRIKQAAAKPQLARQITDEGTSLKQTLTGVEGEIYQVRNQSSQDPLNYPIRLNNKIAALLGVAGSAESRPTKQSYTVFDTLSKELDVQLVRMRQAFSQQLPRLNGLLKEAGLDEIKPSTMELKKPDTVAGRG